MRQLASLSVLSGLEALEIYDCTLEQTRHALLTVRSWVDRSEAALLLPLVDLLTSLHCDSMDPVRGPCLTSAEWAPLWSVQDIVVQLL